MKYNQKCELYEFLCGFATENRRLRFEEVAANRTRYLTVVLEDIFQSHNASAVLRTCDCFGIQDVHIIENKNEYKLNPDVALGASNWLSLYKYNKNVFNTPDCLCNLKKKGYRIIAALPHKEDCCPADLDIGSKMAIMFGTEKDGLSETALKYADGFVKIPMKGFTESFNISVSAAIVLYALTERLRKSDAKWRLSKEELIDIKTGWIKNSVKSAEMIEKIYFQKKIFNQNNKKK